MTTHNNQDDELLTPEGSASSPISPSAADTPVDPTEEVVTEATEQPTKRPTVSLSQGPLHPSSDTGTSTVSAKPKKSLLGFALFTSGVSLGALGCGLTLARGPFVDLASFLEPLAQRGLTGGSMILTGLVLTAMSVVERQLRKQAQALETQEGNAAILQDIFGSMATINHRFDAIETNERQVYAEANMMRNELHQHITNQEGKDEQTGIFHVAASVDKLNANVDQTLKRFGSDLESKLATVREEAQLINQKLEAKLQELKPQDLPDNSELIAAQANIAERLQGLESNLKNTRSQLGEVGDCVQTSVQNIMEEKLAELQPHETYDDSAMLAGQSELSDRLCAMEENLRSTHADMGDCVQSAVQESIQALPQQETHDDSALLASQSEISGRLEALESHLESTRARFSEVQDAVQCSTENLSQSVQETVDTRIDELRNELEQVCNAVESAVETALENMPAQQPISFDSVVQGMESAQAFLASEPGIQTWPLDATQDGTSEHQVQENPPLEILHMPSEEEMASVIDVEQEELAHSLDHLFHPIAPAQEDEADVSEELFLDNIPQPRDPGQDPTAFFDTPEGPAPFLSSSPNLIPGTPGSPFPAPVPLKPTDSDDDEDPPTESSSDFQNPYEPPSDDTGFRFPGWN